jgi:hypothetical protein
MTTKIQWSITKMYCYPQEAGQSDVVFEVNWQCQAQDSGFCANSFGTVPVTYTAGSPFTPYADLTQEQVWGWINPSIDRAEIEANLQTMIDAQKNPTVVTLSLPWNN